MMSDNLQSLRQGSIWGGSLGRQTSESDQRGDSRSDTLAKAKVRSLDPTIEPRHHW
jgi:hypothetical protein